ncbi:hypothetical protein AVEN_211446-1 [Araneus ventricosus]|uniref:EGF-like domain-containing protein n=1 Tax=Araneus ventricosus TaxID=182803 RepID=A0A4Y2N5M3_ARAVE|nr:hypothetical protein AVEN_211446-1 [Araneus ventricosus]
MRYAGKVAILLLFVNELHVQCGTVLKTQNVNETDSRRSLKGYEWADCSCVNGICVNEGGNNICKCNPGYGNFSETRCRACECGPDTNCMWEPGWTGTKICFCKPGYSQKSNKCEACNCGSDTNCTFINQGFSKPGLKKCLCKPGYHEEKGKCVAPLRLKLERKFQLRELTPYHNKLFLYLKFYDSKNYLEVMSSHQSHSPGFPQD